MKVLKRVFYKCMNVKEHEKLSNFTLRQQFKANDQQSFLCCPLYFTVTVGTSTMSTTHTLKRVKPAVERCSLLDNE